MPETQCDKILVRGVNWIGDAVMTMPAIRSIRKARPSAKISLLVKPWVAPLFEKDPNIDEIISYDDRFKSISGRLRLAASLRGRGFCEAVLLQNAFDAALISFLAGIPRRTGYDRDGRRLLLTNAVPFDAAAARLHHIDYYLNLLEKSGINPLRSEPWIYLSAEERSAARQRLARLRRPVIAINPGAAYGSSKRWQPERFAQVAIRIMDELRGGVVILGGPSEGPIAEDILRYVSTSRPGLSSDDLINLAGGTTVRELAAVISESDLLVTNDSGPMHIGYAVGTPLVAIFGSTDPALTGPPNDADIVIKKDMDCSPCFERSCPKGSMRCMDLVPAAEVFDAVTRLAPARRAVFFDRDGTLCRDAHYLRRHEDFELLPGLEGLAKLRDAGFLLIGITNQSGIARGIVAEDFVLEINDIFVKKYGFDGFYYCPHHPDERCSCRKPEPGLLHLARRDFRIDLKGSYMIGDKEIDMLLAKAVGATAVHVRTGQEGSAPNADIVTEGMAEAVDAILDHLRR